MRVSYHRDRVDYQITPSKQSTKCGTAAKEAQTALERRRIEQHCHLRRSPLSRFRYSPPNRSFLGFHPTLTLHSPPFAVGNMASSSSSFSVQSNAPENSGALIKPLPPDLLLVIFIHGCVTPFDLIVVHGLRAAVLKLDANLRLPGSRERIRPSVRSPSAWNTYCQSRSITWSQSA